MSTSAVEQDTTGGTAPTPSRGRRWPRRLLVSVLVLLVLLTGLLLGGGGWYFAGEIDASALTVEPTHPETVLTAARVGDGDITLAVDDAASWRDELGSTGVFGVFAGDSYGQVFGTSSGPGAEITRQFRMLEGTRPQDTESVGWTRNAFPDPEAALGRRTREISYPSDLGDAPAWFVPGRSSTWAVLVHGKGESRVEMLRLMRSTVGAGLPSMAITYRNDVGAPQEPSHRYQYGRTEWRDLAKAVDYATGHGADRVVLVGASMGGGIIASYLQHTPSHPRVAGLVLDAPMLDLGETVSYGASQRPLPLFGHVPGALTWTAKRLATLRYGLDWSAVNYADDSEWLDVPTLVLHGTEDTTVPIALSRQLAADHRDLVRLDTVEGAHHVAAWNADPRGYEGRVRGFIRRL